MNLEIKPFPYDWRSNPVPLRMNEVTTLVLHHMAHPTWTLLDVHEDHLKKGWRGAGYNYWIDFDGTITEVRGTGYGAHSASSNGTSLGIGFRGDYHNIYRKMSSKQFNAGVWLCRYLMEKHDIKRIKGHFEVDSTLCPGQHFPLSEIKSLSFRGFSDPYYYQIDKTHIIEADPLSLRILIADRRSSFINLDDFVNGGYFWHDETGRTYPLGILVSQGRIISNRQPHGKPAGTLIVYSDCRVELKEITYITKEENIWFAISGCTIEPKINMVSAGFTGAFSDIARPCNRPIIGYNRAKNKIIIAARPDSNIARAQLTARNLGCDFAITLDAGDSTNLRVAGNDLFKTYRRLNHIIIWNARYVSTEK